MKHTTKIMNQNPSVKYIHNKNESQLLTYYSYFQEDLVIVSGLYLGSFRSISGYLRVVFGQKKTDWAASRSL